MWASSRREVSSPKRLGRPPNPSHRCPSTAEHKLDDLGAVAFARCSATGPSSPTNGRLTLSWGEEGLVALQRANATALRSSNLCSAVEGHQCDGLGGRPSLFGELTSRRLDAHTWNAPPFAHHWPTLRKSKVNMVKQWPPDQQIIFIQYARGKDAAINDRLRSQRAGARVVVRPYTHQVDKGGVWVVAPLFSGWEMSEKFSISGRALIVELVSP